MAFQPQASPLPCRASGVPKVHQAIALSMKRFTSPAELKVYPGVVQMAVAQQSRWLHLAQVSSGPDLGLLPTLEPAPGYPAEAGPVPEPPLPFQVEASSSSCRPLLLLPRLCLPPPAEPMRSSASRRVTASNSCQGV